MEYVMIDLIRPNMASKLTMKNKSAYEEMNSLRVIIHKGFCHCKHKAYRGIKRMLQVVIFEVEANTEATTHAGYTDYQRSINPLRPIVSCIGSFAYHLSKHLAEILSPLTGASEHTVPNSSGFAEFIAEQTICESETMISFDVVLVSLFTNVPIEGACQTALHRMQTDNSLTALTIAHSLSLLSKSPSFSSSSYGLHTSSMTARTIRADGGSSHAWAARSRPSWPTYTWRVLSMKHYSPVPPLANLGYGRDTLMTHSS